MLSFESVSLRVADVERSVASPALRPFGRTSFRIHDPDGNVLEFDTPSEPDRDTAVGTR